MELSENVQIVYGCMLKYPDEPTRPTVLAYDILLDKWPNAVISTNDAEFKTKLTEVTKMTEDALQVLSDYNLVTQEFGWWKVKSVTEAIKLSCNQ